MVNKQLKERLKNGEIVLGTWNSIPSASLVNVIGTSGIDFVVIDAEHGPISMETAENLVRAADQSGISPIVRVPANDSHLILRALDIGAYGIQVPHISTKTEAVLAVKYSKYHPQGERGFSPFTRAGSYGIELEEYANRANENTLVVLNVEGLEGLRNLKQIAGVPNIDVIFIGPFDLSQSMGKPGKIENPEVIKSIRHSVGIVKSKGLACGSFAHNSQYLDILISCGVQYITYMVDSAMILQAYRDLYEKFNKKKNEVCNG